MLLSLVSTFDFSNSKFHQIRLASLPEGSENMDQLPTRDLVKKFFKAASMLKQPFEQLFNELQSRPSCIIPEASKVHETMSKFESFLVPGLPHRMELTKAQLPENLNPGSNDLTNMRGNIRAVELIADGIVVITFEELESEYVKEYKIVKGDNVWCIGPLSACNKLNSDKAERGQKASIDDNQCLKPWLDSKKPVSVIMPVLVAYLAAQLGNSWSLF
ncbi:UDP-glucosyl transferase 73C1-like protein [Theobroma cacao]|uniref:UDP-glucosyl transferase 73C1-like protein n=1 Tax=Theobroma cacao TaxID=3641 RepID=A0A061ETL8_THECC|nr:UDP-glucosyl transferase 73C1-like protein [Theobroma cacao]